MEEVTQLVNVVAIYAIPVLFAITLHEAAHGYVARHFGDMTAYAQGRISLNPVRHIDIVGTIVVPIAILAATKLAGGAGLLFGWAKPVPVNYSALRSPKRDMIWVAAAGPASNLVMALGWAALMLFVLYYLYRDEEQATAAVWRFSPLTDDETGRLLDRIVDTIHATIYGSMVVAVVQGALGCFIFWVLGVPGAAVWGIALAGAAAKLIAPHRVASVSTMLYLAQGWTCIFTMQPLLAALSPTAMVLLLAGGVLYTVGAVFHLSERIAYHNAIWHSFVLVAAACHFVAVLDAVVLG